MMDVPPQIATTTTTITTTIAITILNGMAMSHNQIY